MEGDAGHWWQTLDILAGKEEKKPQKDVTADIDEWLAKVCAKMAQATRQARENMDAKSDVSGTGKSEKKKEPPPVKYEFFETTFGNHIEIEMK